jgi:hypothetical protein
MLSHIINSKSLSKVKIVKQYYKEKHEVQNVHHLSYGVCSLGWLLEVYLLQTSPSRLTSVYTLLVCIFLLRL